MERNLQGHWEFTGAGNLQGGTIITDVPGIKMQIGRAEDPWEVGDIDGVLYSQTNAGTLRDQATATEGNFYTFTPYVNGYLTIYGKNTNKYCYVMDGKTQVVSRSGGFTGEWNLKEYDLALKAGTTYYVVSQDFFYLHGFTFKPAFLEVDGEGNLTNTLASQDEEEPFRANMNTDKSSFPHLITSEAGDGDVIFAAGDKTVANLKGNNDVVLIGNGPTIVKGIVLHDGAYNDDQLFTYYYLESTVLTANATKFNDADIEDQDYVNANTNNNTYSFTFNTPIKKVSDEAFNITLRTDAGEEEDITSKATISNTDIRIVFDPGKLVSGSTYRITIAAGSVMATNDATDENAKIQRTFSILKDDKELQLELVHPLELANVGTPVVLSLNRPLTDNNDAYKGSGYLKKDGTDERIEVDFSFKRNILVVKPQKTLEEDTDYTLVLESGSIIGTGGEVLSTDKAFSFTTDAMAGVAPEARVFTPTPDPNGDSPVDVTGKCTISVTFDQAVRLEPYSFITVTPVNGAEADATGNQESNMTVNADEDSRTISFDATELKYDLYYQAVIPANTVYTAGDMTNSEPITWIFRMDRNPNSTPVDPDDFYPHTWDFGKFGDPNTPGTTAYNITSKYYSKDNSLTGSSKNVIYPYDETKTVQESYVIKNGYDQGADIYLKYRDDTKEVLNEFAGIRISLVSERSPRFEIRDLTVTDSKLNLDGTNKYVFRMNGNTHYMTLSNVPKGKLYMVAGSKLLGINSPNAKFINQNDGVAYESDTKITNTNGTKKLVIDVEEAGDVIFCVGDFTCEKIATAVDYKKATSSSEYYFTDCQAPDMRYDLTGEFTNTKLTAYTVVKNDNFDIGSKTITLTPLDYNAAKAEEGSIVRADAENTDIPIFRADVNTMPTLYQSSLTGILEDTYIGSTDPEKGMRNYIFTNIVGKVNPETGSLIDGSKSESSVGFYRAVAGTIGAHKSYLQLPLSLTDGTDAQAFFFYINLNGENTTTGIGHITSETTNAEEDVYYTLTGLRLSGKPSTKGMYILNGKKVLVK